MTLMMMRKNHQMRLKNRHGRKDRVAAKARQVKIRMEVYEIHLSHLGHRTRLRPMIMPMVVMQPTLTTMRTAMVHLETS